MRISRMLLAAASTFVLAATAAQAQVDVELAFTPDTAVPGQSVTLFASIANLSSDPVQASFTVAVTVEHASFDPISFNSPPFTLPLAASVERSVEVPFVVPPLPMGGTLTITVTATVGESTDTTTARLTILGAAPMTSTESAVRSLGTKIGKALAGGDDATATEGASMSAIKGLYR
jgi:hypothetical protein